MVWRRGRRMMVMMVVVAEVRRWRVVRRGPGIVVPAVVVRRRVVQEVRRRRSLEQLRRVRPAVGPRLAPLATRVVGARTVAVFAGPRARVFAICQDKQNKTKKI